MECRSMSECLAPAWLCFGTQLSSHNRGGTTQWMGRDHMVRWEGAESELKLYLSAQLILEETDSIYLLKIHHILVTTGFVIEHPCWGIHIHAYYTAVPSSNIPCRTTVSFPNPSISYFTQASLLSASFLVERQPILSNYSDTSIFIIIFVEEY